LAAPYNHQTSQMYSKKKKEKKLPVLNGKSDYRMEELPILPFRGFRRLMALDTINNTLASSLLGRISTPSTHLRSTRWMTLQDEGSKGPRCTGVHGAYCAVHSGMASEDLALLFTA
jgi:hypothetical protein